MIIWDRLRSSGVKNVVIKQYLFMMIFIYVYYVFNIEGILSMDRYYCVRIQWTPPFNIIIIIKL